MCGRYALSIQAAFVRHQFQQHGMPVDDAPPDEDTRSTYNFAPGYYGLVYRADVPYHGAGHSNDEGSRDTGNDEAPTESQNDNADQKFKLQAMKWGLVPFWTKRNPDYGSVMKTINARDDSLAENRGMWNSMKKTKRCIVIAEGFYEWLKKNGGRDKMPHYVKRKDGQLMLFAGLWDCVQYEGSADQNWTYTIITTDSNKQLKFLHDRMPVILENSSDAVKKWLDPTKTEWSSELQSLLKPYQGDLECYPVSKDVGKVGNDSPNFIIPIDSSKNKSNIANFFANAKQDKKDGSKTTNETENSFTKSQDEGSQSTLKGDEDRATIDEPRTEDNAPMPDSGEPSSTITTEPYNREAMPNFSTDPSSTVTTLPWHKESAPSTPWSTESTVGEKRKLDDKNAETPAKKASKVEESLPYKPQIESPSRKFRSSTSNNTPAKSPLKAKDGSQKITNFFAK